MRWSCRPYEQFLAFAHCAKICLISTWCIQCHSSRVLKRPVPHGISQWAIPVLVWDWRGWLSWFYLVCSSASSIGSVFKKYHFCWKITHPLQFFFIQAALKLFDGQLGTVIEYNSSISELQAPSVSVCPIEKKWLSGTKVNIYMRLNQLTLIQLSNVLKSYPFNSLSTRWWTSMITYRKKMSSRHSILLPNQILPIQSNC